MAGVGTFIEAIGQGGVRCCSLDRYAVGKLPSGGGYEGDDGSGLVMDGKLSFSAIVDNLDLPKAILGVAPLLQDGVAIECDFEPVF